MICIYYNECSNYKAHGKTFSILLMLDTHSKFINTSILARHKWSNRPFMSRWICKSSRISYRTSQGKPVHLYSSLYTLTLVQFINSLLRTSDSVQCISLTRQLFIRWKAGNLVLLLVFVESLAGFLAQFALWHQFVEQGTGGKQGVIGVHRMPTYTNPEL